MHSVDHNLIVPQSAIFELTAQDRARAFAEICRHLAEVSLIPQDFTELVLQALEQREAKLSTAVGRHLAIPHASIRGLPKVARLIARSSSGIDADAPDGLPVHFFYVSLIPEDDYSTHLRTIAALSAFFRSPGVLDQLRSAGDAHSLMGVFNTPK